MPETLTPPSPLTGAPPAPSAPAPSAPSPAPAAPAAPSSPASGMKDYIKGLTVKPEPKTPPAPAGDIPPKEPIVAAPATAAPADDHPDVPDAIWDKAPKNLKNAYYKTKRELEGKLTANESRLKELESKPNQSPADLKRIKELEERSAKLEKDLEEREKVLTESSYERSQEFKRDHKDKWEKTAKRISGEMAHLRIKETDTEGNLKERPATGADLDEIRTLSPFMQDKRVNEMFGTSAYRVFAYISELDGLDRARNEAISNANTKAEENRRTYEKQFSERSNEYKTHADRASEEIVKTHSMYFAPDPANPEATEALERGLKYVDEAASNNAKMSPKDQAETATMIRYLAGCAPRLMTEVNQLKVKLAARDEELAKYRKSSPGSAPSPTGSNGAKAPEPEKRGINAIKEMMLAGKK